MSYMDYEKAQKLGMKAFKNAVSKGEYEYLPVLDEILENVEIQGEQNLGLVQIPLNQVVGTSNVGRTFAFANNFMPILDFKTEFGSKWSNLCEAQINEGIRDPIKVYEYMNKYYVVEGNKRVSVMKYFGAVTIPAYVTRKIPKRTDELQNKIYYEFMEFYKYTGVNYLWFSQEGCFKRVLEIVAGAPDVEWTEDQIKDFGSAHHNFNLALKSRGGDKLPITTGDAFLIFMEVYGFENIKDLTEAEMKEKVDLLWDEFIIESQGREIELRMEPAKQGRRKLMDYFWSPSSKNVKVAFVFDKNPKESEWLYGHELGRLYLEEHCQNRVSTVKVYDLNTEEETVEAMEKLIEDGVNVIFTTSSQQVNASLKVAVNHPDVQVLNCSLNTSHKLIRTYYARLYEVKFLAGIIAGALTENGRIGYLADYPIFGMPANINAFALGVGMVNPNAKVYLQWTTVKGISREAAIEEFRKNGVKYISDQVMIKPNAANRQFGLYCIDEKETVNLAMPVYHWGIFYENILEAVLNGSFKHEEDDNDKPINYWWGLSAGVVDLITSNRLPEGTTRLVEIIKDLILKNELSPFEGILKANDGTVKNDKDTTMSPEDIMKMNWLVDNIVGEIPELHDLKEEAKSIVELKGVNEEV